MLSLVSYRGMWTKPRTICKHADEKGKYFEFQVGNTVLVNLQPYRQHSWLLLALTKNQKLSLRYFGPFSVAERIGQVAFSLLLPPAAKEHYVFNCSQFKLCKGDHSTPDVPLPIITVDWSPVLQPVSILQSRIVLWGCQQI